MYQIVSMQDTVSIPPSRMTEDFDLMVTHLVSETFEGRLEQEHGIIVMTMNTAPIGSGRVVHGSGDIYQDVGFEALVFKPEDNEITDGMVAEIVEFGAFIHVGPLDALVHSSQIMSDYMTPDRIHEKIQGRDTGRVMVPGDNVRARIVSVKLNERDPRSSKIGVTMRQVSLGKFEWIEEDRRRGKSGEE